MPTVQLKARDLEPAIVFLTAWAGWLRPGVLALRIGQVKAALIAQHALVNEQRRALVQELDPKRNGDGTVNFGERTDEFDRRYHEIADAVVAVSLPHLLGEWHVAETEKQMRVLKPGETPDPVDFAALACVMEGTAEVADA